MEGPQLQAFLWYYPPKSLRRLPRTECTDSSFKKTLPGWLRLRSGLYGCKRRKRRRLCALYTPGRPSQISYEDSSGSLQRRIFAFSASDSQKSMNVESFQYWLELSLRNHILFPEITKNAFREPTAPFVSSFPK